jgi:hypothetical protein
VTVHHPLDTGDTGTVAQLSLCAGGLLRTWPDTGPSTLWSVPDCAYLHSVLGIGVVARTAHERNRFREVAIVSETNSTLELPGTVMELQPARPPTESTYGDVRTALARAIEYALANDEYLLIERGGWDSCIEPFCLFTVIPGGDGYVSVIETSPDPEGSGMWAPHVVGDGESVALSTPAGAETLELAPLIMLEAIGTWDLAPWDLALTFGTRGT